MSKGNNGKLTIYLEPGEACVVLEKKFWDHMVRWYSIMADDTGDKVEKENWHSVIREVNHWVSNTYFDPIEVATIIEDDDDRWN